MNTKKIKIFSIVVVFIIIAGLNVYQLMKIENMEKTIEASEDKISELEDEQIINKKQNKALSVELESLESDYRDSLEEIESFEDKVNKQDKEIDKLEKDLLSKKEKEAEKARLAKKNDKKVVSTASSSKRAIGDYKVTSYAIGDGYTPGTVTANGTDVSNTIYSPEGYRVIAVDTNVIPMNSIVEVTLNGETFLAKASDTGSAIKGKKIDLLVSSPAQARKNGIMRASLKIVK